MKAFLTFSVAFLACAGTSLNQVAIAVGPAETYCIYSPSKPRGRDNSLHFQLKARGDVYFLALKPFQALSGAEKPLPHPLFTSMPEWVFRLEKAGDGHTRLRLRDTGEYLSANYNTQPPIVVVKVEPGDTSNWRIIPTGKPWREGTGEHSWHEQFYIQIVGPHEKDLWLSVDATPINAQAPDASDVVREYRKAVLTEEKTIFEIEKREVSK